ncbi:unnamed protein product [marine sediment metagenome]|uniref:Uncharacterized protein n=1 Tax=marine sediment metagenome TaxID=412755 RepID=X0XSW1_9ZZZZ
MSKLSYKQCNVYINGKPAQTTEIDYSKAYDDIDRITITLYPVSLTINEVKCGDKTTQEVHIET